MPWVGQLLKMINFLSELQCKKIIRYQALSKNDRIVTLITMLADQNERTQCMMKSQGQHGLVGRDMKHTKQAKNC